MGAVPPGGSEASGQFCPPETRVEEGLLESESQSGSWDQTAPPPPPPPRAALPKLFKCTPHPAGSPAPRGPGLPLRPTPTPGPGGASQRPAVPMATHGRSDARWAHSQPVGSLRSGRQGKWARLEAGGWARPGRRAAGCGLRAGKGRGRPGGFWKAQEAVGLGAGPEHRAAPSRMHGEPLWDFPTERLLATGKPP